jgi:hypothetical protein
MLRRMLGAASAAALLLSMTVGIVQAGNPSGTGRPGAECGEENASMEPHGFTTPGFATAEDHYNPGSQYDVACYQSTPHH